MACESYGTSVVPLFHFMPKNGWIFCLILRQQSDFFNNFKNLNEYETFEFTSVCIFHDVRGACLWSGQGGRIKMRSPPKVLTGNFRPSQLSFFLS